MNDSNLAIKTTYNLTVAPDQKPERIDSFVQQNLTDYSRTFIQKLIEQGLITLNGKKTKARIIVKPHDTITISIPVEEPAYVAQPTPEQKKELESLAVKIIYSDENFAVIDKPAGIVVHKPSSYSKDLTVVDWLIHTIDNIADVGHPTRPGIVHRLDKDTSGLMLIARSAIGHTLLSKLFKDRTIEKTYLALVRGHPDREGTIDLPIGRNPIIRNQMTVDGIEARPAITHYKVVEYFDSAALLALKLETGRTHQIRVHLKAIGHPIIGDELYGLPSHFIKRQALHAHKLAFTLQGKEYNFESPLPEDMQRLIEKLSKS